MAKKEETYNEAIEKLRKIVAEIENGDLDVDILSEKVKEATRLIKLCKEKLYKVDEEGKKEAVMQSLMKKIGQHAAHRLGGTVEVTVLVFSNRFGVLGETQCQEI